MPTPILALANVTVRIAAGIPHRGFCTVRLLDRISLAVHNGDMVVLRGQGSTALLRALSGDDRMPSATSGERMVFPGLTVRTGRIPMHLVSPVMDAWSVRTPVPLPLPMGQVRPANNAVVYLLHATRSARSLDDTLHDWVYWSASLRRRNGALVVADTQHIPSAGAIVPSLRADSVREGFPQCRCRRPAVRILHIGFGRITGESTHAGQTCSRCLRH